MNIVQGTPYFLQQYQPKQYPYLTQDTETEVLIIGGGVTAALTLWAFHQKEIPCMLIDQYRFGYGSTAITTALLQYELDDNVHELKSILSMEQIQKAYDIGRNGVDEIEKIVTALGDPCDFERNDCLLMTTKDKDRESILTEYKDRLEMGLPVSYIEENNCSYPLKIKAGVIAKNGGARINPYMFTSKIFDSLSQLPLYENTEAVTLTFEKDHVLVQTRDYHRIKAQKVILCTGYATKALTNRTFYKSSITYNIVTNPIEELPDLKLLIRDNENKYHYLRQTKDLRWIVGGEDSTFAPMSQSDLIINQKNKSLLSYVKTLFPEYKKKFEISHHYCGMFGLTKDNLGVVGYDREDARLVYCLGYGANGMLFAATGSKMLSEEYIGHPQDDLALFHPDRDTL